MDPQYKFKLKTYLFYLLVEPWSENISLPNFRTIAWLLILAAIFFRLRILLLVSIIFGIIVHLIQEFKSGKYVYWYRQRRFRGQREAIKKVREERRNKRDEEEGEG